MPTNDFKTVAGGSGANVVSQATFEANVAELTNGFTEGKSNSKMFNKLWRQSSIIAAMIAQFINDKTGENAIDDGTKTTLLANFKTAISNTVSSGGVGTLIDSKIFDFTSYYDISSSSWLDVTGFTTTIDVIDQPALLDVSVFGSLFLNNGGQAVYLRLIIDGGEYSNEIIDYCTVDGLTSGSSQFWYNLKALVPLTQNVTYTIKVQARNSTASPGQNSRFNATQSFTSSADPDTRQRMRLRLFKM